MLDAVLPMHPTYREVRRYAMLSGNHTEALKRWDHGWELHVEGDSTVYPLTDAQFAAWEEAVLQIHTRIL
jgi:hypothetical protein